MKIKFGEEIDIREIENLSPNIVPTIYLDPGEEISIRSSSGDQLTISPSFLKHIQHCDEIIAENYIVVSTTTGK